MRSMSSEQARSALDAAPDAMVIIDGEGIIRYANQQTATLFDYAHDEIVGRSVDQLLPERLRVHHMEHRRQYWQSPRVRPMGAGLELFASRRDGNEFPVEISLSPIRDGEQMLVAATIRDVTERKRVQAELMTARRSADRANRAKSRFLATASHDLRQPVQSLALLNGTLRRITTDAGALEVIAQQERAINSASRLLNALLDISKLESGAVKPDPGDFQVAALFEDLRREFAEVAADKGLELQVHAGEDAVRSDRSLVEQILRNLLSNAIKYTRQGWVRLASRAEEEQVCLEVADTGIGIPADQLPFIYDEFYQVGGVAGRPREGYGLGLSIVQRLVSLLGLQLDVRSEIGRGSSFVLRLPSGSLAPAAGRTGEQPGLRTARTPTVRPRVLLVEDEDAVRQATRLLLRVEGYDVREAASLTEALEVVERQGAIDVVITDYHLGEGQTGSEVIRLLRERLGAGLAAVLTSGDTSSVIRELPHDAQLRLVSKPLRADDLLTLLRELLTARRAMPG